MRSIKKLKILKFDSREQIVEARGNHICGNESHEHWRLRAFISIAMYAAIRRYEDLSSRNRPIPRKSF